ncbi:MAG: HAMP domain-containing sensor histidine kinase [Gemmatimonadales bacterium]
MASIGLTAVAAFDAQRAIRAQDKVVSGAIHEFSSFAAWSYGEHLKQQMGAAAVEVVGAVNHGENMHTNPRIPGARELAHYLPTDFRCDCHRTLAGPNPASFVGFKLGSRDVDVAQNLYAKPTEGWRVDPVPGQALPPRPSFSYADLRWIADTLTVQARLARTDEHGYGLIVGNSNGRVRPIVYTLMPTSWGDTMVYGAEYTPAAFQSMLARVLDGNGLLPETFTKGKRNRDVVAIRVMNGTGETIYESVPGVSSPTFTQLRLPDEYGSLLLHVMIRPGQASALIIGGTPASRLPLLLGLLALAAMMSVVAVVQIRRETELAGMRADFVSSISHELRTPLAQIKLYLETIRLGRAKTEEQREWSLKHIDRETTRLGNLVENVLRFSRLGRPDELPAQPISLRDEVERIVDEFRPLAASRKSEIEVDFQSDPHVAIRHEALRHAVVNLLDNAVKYGPVSQTLRVEVGSRGSSAYIAVMDQGSGVPLNQREAIWRPFARAKTATDAAGSGIGLTIVRDVAMQNGGKAWVEDGAGGGARFVISLPRVPVDTAMQEVRPHAEHETSVPVG